MKLSFIFNTFVSFHDDSQTRQLIWWIIFVRGAFSLHSRTRVTFGVSWRFPTTDPSGFSTENKSSDKNTSTDRPINVSRTEDYDSARCQRTLSMTTRPCKYLNGKIEVLFRPLCKCCACVFHLTYNDNTNVAQLCFVECPTKVKKHEHALRYLFNAALVWKNQFFSRLVSPQTQL